MVTARPLLRPVVGKALVIGADYHADAGAKGAVPAAARRAARAATEAVRRLRGAGFGGGVRLLTDVGNAETMPTRRAVEEALAWLGTGCRAGAALLLVFIGAVAASGDLLPVDYSVSGGVTVADAISAVAARMCEGARLIVVVDPVPHLPPHSHPATLLPLRHRAVLSNGAARTAFAAPANPALPHAPYTDVVAFCCSLEVDGDGDGDGDSEEMAVGTAALLGALEAWSETAEKGEGAAAASASPDAMVGFLREVARHLGKPVRQRIERDEAATADVLAGWGLAEDLEALDADVQKYFALEEKEKEAEKEGRGAGEMTAAARRRTGTLRNIARRCFGTGSGGRDATSAATLFRRELGARFAALGLPQHPLAAWCGAASPSELLRLLAVPFPQFARMMCGGDGGRGIQHEHLTVAHALLVRHFGAVYHSRRARAGFDVSYPLPAGPAGDAEGRGQGDARAAAAALDAFQKGAEARLDAKAAEALVAKVRGMEHGAMAAFAALPLSDLREELKALGLEEADAKHAGVVQNLLARHAVAAAAALRRSETKAALAPTRALDDSVFIPAGRIHPAGPEAPAAGRPSPLIPTALPTLGVLLDRMVAAAGAPPPPASDKDGGAAPRRRRRRVALAVGSNLPLRDVVGSAALPRPHDWRGYGVVPARYAAVLEAGGAAAIAASPTAPVVGSPRAVIADAPDPPAAADGVRTGWRARVGYIPDGEGDLLLDSPLWLTLQEACDLAATTPGCKGFTFEEPEGCEEWGVGAEGRGPIAALPGDLSAWVYFKSSAAVAGRGWVSFVAPGVEEWEVAAAKGLGRQALPPTAEGGDDELDGAAARCLRRHGVHPGWRQRLFNFYQHHNPGKLPSVTATLREFCGHEAAVLEALVAKYGPEPETDGTLDVPEGWALVESRAGDLYYKHAEGRVQWERPTGPPRPREALL